MNHRPMISTPNTYEIREDVNQTFYIELGDELVAHGFESRQDARAWLRENRGVTR